MNLLLPITLFIAAASAHQIYNSAPQQDAYANSAEIYQSQLEYQQQGLYKDQSQAYTGHASHAAAYERPSAEKGARILSYEMESNGHGYQYSYETENGIKAQEVGQSHKGTEAHGAYSYKGDDGQTYTVTYTADEHGFRPQGAHLPTPPPIPEAIAKAIEQNEKDEAAGIYDDGKYVEQHNHESEGHGHEDEFYQAQLHQAQAHQAQIQASSHHSYQPQSHQSTIHQSQSYQPHVVSSHASYKPQASGHQAYQPQIHQTSSHQAYQPQSHQASVHQSYPSHQSLHVAAVPTQSAQIHHHHQTQQPSQVYQISSPSFQHFEPSAFQHEGISGYVSSESLYHKH